MKTPIVYYGGKTNMIRHILPLLPQDHRIYVEPFCGGAAVLFGKQPAEVEVINDNLSMVTTFYRVAKNDFPNLRKRIQATLHAEEAKIQSKNILIDIEHHSDLDVAWAFWAQNALSFSHKVFGGFAFAKSPIATTTANRIDQFTDAICNRLRHVQVFSRDAIDVIEKFDGEDTFYYLDPPYANSDCGHYTKGKNVFYDLLEAIPKLKGKWLLSSYMTPEVEALRRNPGIYTRDISQTISASGGKSTRKGKVECLTCNYQI